MPDFKCTRLMVLALMLAFSLPAQAKDDIPPPSDDAAVWYLTAAVYYESMDDAVKKLEAITGQDKPFDLAKAKRALAPFGDVLRYLRRGTTLKRCTWPVTLKEDGPYALLPHLSYQRKFARLLLLNSRVRLEQGDASGSLDDAMAAMRLARHGASEHTLIGVLVQISIDALTITHLAEHLHRYDRAQLEALRKSLKGLPAKVTVRQAFATERVVVVWLRGLLKKQGLGKTAEILNELIGQSVISVSLTGPADAKPKPNPQPQPKPKPADKPEPLKPVKSVTAEQFEAWLVGLDKAYKELDRIAGLPPEKSLAAGEKFNDEVGRSKNLLVRLFLPALNAAKFSQYRADSKLAMLDAMIAYRLGGAKAFAKVIDPISKKPFDMNETDKGVVVSSPSEILKRGGKPWSLTFPAEVAKPLD